MRDRQGMAAVGLAAALAVLWSPEAWADSDKWLPLLENRTPVVPAALQNTAGIVGAAMAATSDVTH